MKKTRYSILLLVLAIIVPSGFFIGNIVSASTDQFTVSLSVTSDATPPSIPAGLGATAVSSSAINLSWTASTDNVAVAGYVVRRGGVIIASSTPTTYSDTGLTASTAYTYTVEAYDASFNYSGQSGSAGATTQAPSSGGGPGDVTPPTLSSLSPTNGATGVALNTTLQITMSELINKVSGPILVKRLSDNGVADSIEVSGAAVTLAGSMATVALSAPLLSNTTYYIEVPYNSFVDQASNPFAGFSGTSTWSFTTVDTVPPVISGVSTLTSATTATTTFSTNEPALATYQWGTSTSYGLGTGSEVLYGTSHSFALSGLTPATLYYYRITAKDSSLNQSTPTTGTFTTTSLPPPPDVTAPANPSNFTGVAGVSTVNLSWTNPSDADFAAVRVLRKTSGYPASETDGVLVYDGGAESTVDSGLSEGTLYYYTIFARDTALNYSSGAIFSATTGTTAPLPPPTVPPTTPPSGTPTGSGSTGSVTGGSTGSSATSSSTEVESPFAQATATGTPSVAMTRLTLRDVQFTELEPDKPLPFSEDVVQTTGAKKVRVSISYSKLPEVLKSIAISIRDPQTQKTSTYLLRVNKDKTAYEAVVPPFAQGGTYDFSVDVLDLEHNALTRLAGAFDVRVPVKLPAFIPEQVTQTVAETKRIITEPVHAIAPVMTPVGVAVGAGELLFLSTRIRSLYDLYLLFLKFIGLLTGVFRRKKGAPWGVVYDSVTKRPLDPAHVVAALRNTQESKGEAITDLDGRYGFLLAPGEYHIVANKTHYKFPSTKLKGRSRDELYDNLYFGNPFQVKEGGIVQYNIPMDPLEFDWNEFSKNKAQRFKLHSSNARLRFWVLNGIFFGGFIFSVLSAVLLPNVWNLFTVIVYMAITLFQVSWKATHKITRVMSKETGEPLPFALIKVWIPGLNTVIKKSVTDERGRFYFLVSPGSYVVTIEEKLPDGTYREVLRTKEIEFKHGVVHGDLLV